MGNPGPLPQEADTPCVAKTSFAAKIDSTNRSIGSHNHFLDGTHRNICTMSAEMSSHIKIKPH
jgi:hypothetical protein